MHSTFLRVRTMGVQVGFRLRNGNSHRQPGETYGLARSTLREPATSGFTHSGSIAARASPRHRVTPGECLKAGWRLPASLRRSGVGSAAVPEWRRLPRPLRQGAGPPAGGRMSPVHRWPSHQCRIGCAAASGYHPGGCSTLTFTLPMRSLPAAPDMLMQAECLWCTEIRA
jgi:hypothetical protein